jgi:Zn-dependent peptidase ImmA (M78 family)
MQVSLDALPVVFVEAKKVKEALDQYCLAPDKVPVSVDDILFAINELYGVSVTVKLVPLATSHVRGNIEIYEGLAVIHLNSALNLQTSRYVVVKEACHVMLMNAENCTEDPTSIIEFFVQEGLATNGNLPADVLSEELTKFGAVELLFPHTLRQAAKERLASGADTLFTLSEWLAIPDHLVEYALSDRYMEMCARLRAKLSI